MAAMWSHPDSSKRFKKGGNNGIKKGLSRKVEFHNTKCHEHRNSTAFRTIVIVKIALLVTTKKKNAGRNFTTSCFLHFRLLGEEKLH